MLDRIPFPWIYGSLHRSTFAPFDQWAFGSVTFHGSIDTLPDACVCRKRSACARKLVPGAACRTLRPDHSGNFLPWTSVPGGPGPPLHAWGARTSIFLDSGNQHVRSVFASISNSHLGTFWDDSGSVLVSLVIYFPTFWSPFPNNLFRIVLEYISHTFKDPLKLRQYCSQHHPSTKKFFIHQFLNHLYTIPWSLKHIFRYFSGIDFAIDSNGLSFLLLLLWAPL